MDHFTRDLRYAVRALSRARGAAAVAVLTLALGIGATTTMFSVVYATLLRPLPFAEPDRLMLLYITRTTPKDGVVRLRWSRPVTDALEKASAFEGFATFSAANIAVGSREAGVATQSTVGSRESAVGSPPEQIDGEMISPDYFRVLRVTPSAGRAFLAEEDGAPDAHPIVIVSDRLWRRRFAADPSLVGGIIRVNDVPLTVVGIAPPGFAGLSGRAELWFPRTMAPRLTYSDYLITPQHFISVVGRLRPGVSATQATAELASMSGRFADAVAPPDGQWSAAALPAKDARVDATLRRSVLMLLGAAVCVLLISCVNVAGLLLARARTRRREIAIRLAMGSSR